MINTMKKLIIAILLIALTGCTTNTQLGADRKVIIEKTPTELIAEKITTEKVSIDSIQEAELKKIKKYKHVPEYTKDEIKYLINEYEKPNGDVGYQTITNDGKTIKSTCTGTGCVGKIYEKAVYINSTSTKEIK